MDLWRTAKERENLQYQGICNQNTLRLHVGADSGDIAVVEDKAVTDALGNQLYIPLNFELLDSHMPFYQASLGDRLEYKLTFNDNSRVIKATEDPSSYSIENISLEYYMITDPELARQIPNQYTGSLAILYNRLL